MFLLDISSPWIMFGALAVSLGLAGFVAIGIILAVSKRREKHSSAPVAAPEQTLPLAEDFQKNFARPNSNVSHLLEEEKGRYSHRQYDES